MLCNNCGKNEATTFYKENINGQVKNLALCPECASNLIGKTSQFDSFFNNSIWDDEFFKNPFGAWGNTLFSGSKQAISGGRQCKTCKTTESELRRTGRAGCADCYNEFSDILIPYIKKLHGVATHVGTAPQPIKQERNQLEDLKNRLSEAVKAENYEEAAKLRDEIRRQEGEQNA